MISWLSSWARGIIIAVIVGIIIQMILPEGKNKKYIKVVIGVYVLFCIINPVVGKSINLDELGLEKYLSVNSNVKDGNQNNIYDTNVTTIFKNNLISDIKTELKSKGYTSNNVDIEIDKDCNIRKIRIEDISKVDKDAEVKQKEDDEVISKERENVVEINTNINKVEIGVKSDRVEEVSTKDKEELIMYLSENYKIDKNMVSIK